MVKKFIYLEWKSFLRAANLKSNMVIKILTIIFVLYLTGIFLSVGIGAYYVLKEMKLDPLKLINQGMVYYLLLDLTFRLLMQKLPALNIRPLLSLPINRNKIVHYSLFKTILSYFNLTHLFFFVPFSIVLVIEGYAMHQVFTWHLGIMMLIFCNNFFNILLGNKDRLFIGFIAMIAIFGGLQYYEIFDITKFVSPFFEYLYQESLTVLLPIGLFLSLYFITFKYFISNLYLDAGLATKQQKAQTQTFKWLDQFGTLGTFLKNDLRLLMRNKRSRTTLTMSFLFLFYGLLFFTNPMYAKGSSVMYIFAGIFVSGGFLMTFGQFVPSWDSAFYPLMMTQNIPYRNYISSKWWLMVIGTVISAILASFYIYFGLKVYLSVLSGAIFNIGVNAYLVLLGGAYTKTPIDLSSGKGAFGDKKAFNFRTMLTAIPQFILPLLLYYFGQKIHSQYFGFGLVAGFGIIGFSFRNVVFNWIEKIYKKEKYATLEAYKQKNN